MNVKALPLSGLILVLTLAACGGAQLPDANIAPSQAIAAAEERNVEDNPEAKLHLKLARDQLAKAEQLRQEGEEDEAKVELIKAQADADYALALLRRDAAREEAEEVKTKVRKLREEMQASEES